MIVRHKQIAAVPRRGPRAVRGLTRLTHRTARFALPALAVASLSAWACGGPSTSLPNCESRIFITLPDAGAVTIASVSSDQPCAPNGHGPDYVVVSSAREGTCQVQYVLTNGDTYAFTVEFRVTHTGRCAGDDMVVDASIPVLVDAGH